MTAEELRALIRAYNLTEALPRTYYYLDGVALDEIFGLLAEYHRTRETAAREAAKAREAAEESLEELQTRLREILHEGALEDADGDARFDRTDLLQSLRGALDADYQVDRTAVLAHLRPVPTRVQNEHRFQVFPHGVEWCDRCGLLLRTGSKKRFYLPGIGEVKALPPCAPVARALSTPAPTTGSTEGPS